MIGKKKLLDIITAIVSKMYQRLYCKTTKKPDGIIGILVNW